MKKQTKFFTCTILLESLIGVHLYLTSRKNKKDLLKAQETANKYKELMHILDKWLLKKQKGKKLIQFFAVKGIKSIAIYGMSYVGERLYDELKNSDIEIKYAIDQSANGIYVDLNVLSLKDDLPEVDAIIVTPTFYYDEISKNLMKKVNSKVISLDTVLNSI